MKRHVTEYVLYRWRYLLSIVFAIGLVIGLFVYGAFFIPDGMRAEEQEIAVASGSLAFTNFDPSSVINLPYLLLQRASFELFGVSVLSIKLPSIVFGVASVIGLFMLIREWFRPNIAIITGIIAVTMPALIFAAQDATPTIYAMAISVWLLLAATRVTRGHTPVLAWKIACFVLFALNLYTPLGIYLNIAIVSTMIFHPHIRLVVHKFNLNYVALSVTAALLVLVPLIYSTITQPAVGLTLLGLPEQWPVDYLTNAVLLLERLFGAYGERLPTAPPIISVGLLSIIVIGLSRFFLVKHTARSYITWLWLLMLLPLLLLVPDNAPAILPLVILLTAMGITALIAEWYKLFPRNPYARIFGLLPLGLIVAGLSIAGISRYTNAYNYTPSIANQFNSDVRILQKALSSAEEVSDTRIHVVVNEENEPFYTMMAKYNQDFVASTTLKVPTPLIVSGDYVNRSEFEATPERIFTSRLRNDADRFYLYTEVKK